MNLQSLEYALAEKSLGQNILAHFKRKIKPDQKKMERPPYTNQNL